MASQKLFSSSSKPSYVEAAENASCDEIATELNSYKISTIVFVIAFILAVTVAVGATIQAFKYYRENLELLLGSSSEGSSSSKQQQTKMLHRHTGADRIDHSPNGVGTSLGGSVGGDVGGTLGKPPAVNYLNSYVQSPGESLNLGSSLEVDKSGSPQRRGLANRSGNYSLNQVQNFTIGSAGDSVRSESSPMELGFTQRREQGAPPRQGGDTPEKDISRAGPPRLADQPPGLLASQKEFSSPVVEGPSPTMPTPNPPLPGVMSTVQSLGATTASSSALLSPLPQPVGVGTTKLLQPSNPLRLSGGAAGKMSAYLRRGMSQRKVNKIVYQLKQGLWQKGRMIGKGATGTVYLCILNDGSFVAMKQLDMSGANKEEMKNLCEELQLMSRLKSDHIIRYFHAELNDVEKTINLFMEYIHGGPLSTLIQRLDGKLQESVARKYVKQIVKGLAFLHEHRVVHRDIKGDNILIESEGNIKLADFGSAKLLQTLHQQGLAGSKSQSFSNFYGRGESFSVRSFSANNNNNTASASAGKYLHAQPSLAPTHTIIGTPLWMAPEVVNPDHGALSQQNSSLSIGGAGGEGGGSSSGDHIKQNSSGEQSVASVHRPENGYTTRADIWSLGICVGELLNHGKPPWPNFESAWEAMYHIGSLTEPPTLPTPASPNCMDFMKKCLVINPKDRPTARQLLHHPWLQEGDPEDEYFEENELYLMDDSSGEFKDTIDKLRRAAAESRSASAFMEETEGSGGNIIPLNSPQNAEQLNADDSLAYLGGSSYSENENGSPPRTAQTSENMLAGSTGGSACGEGKALQGQQQTPAPLSTHIITPPGGAPTDGVLKGSLSSDRRLLPSPAGKEKLDLLSRVDNELPLGTSSGQEHVRTASKDTSTSHKSDSSPRIVRKHSRTLSSNASESTFDPEVSKRSAAALDEIVQAHKSSAQSKGLPVHGSEVTNEGSGSSGLARTEVATSNSNVTSPLALLRSSNEKPSYLMNAEALSEPQEQQVIILGETEWTTGEDGIPGGGPSTAQEGETKEGKGNCIQVPLPESKTPVAGSRTLTPRQPKQSSPINKHHNNVNGSSTESPLGGLQEKQRSVASYGFPSHLQGTRTFLLTTQDDAATATTTDSSSFQEKSKVEQSFEEKEDEPIAVSGGSL